MSYYNPISIKSKEFFSQFDTLEKCNQMFSRKSDARLIYDLVKFLQTGDRFWVQVFGDDYINEPFLVLVYSYTFGTRSRVVNPQSNSLSSWSIENRYSPVKIVDIIRNQNHSFLSDKRRWSNSIAILTDKVAVFNCETQIDLPNQIDDLILYFKKNKISYFLEPSLTGYHFFFPNYKDLSYCAKGNTDIKDKNGNPIIAEILANKSWNKKPVKKDNLKACILGCSLVESYADKISIYFAEENTVFQDIPFNLIPIKPSSRLISVEIPNDPENPLNDSLTVLYKNANLSFSPVNQESRILTLKSLCRFFIITYPTISEKEFFSQCKLMNDGSFLDPYDDHEIREISQSIYKEVFLNNHSRSLRKKMIVRDYGNGNQYEAVRQVWDNLRCSAIFDELHNRQIVMVNGIEYDIKNLSTLVRNELCDAFPFSEIMNQVCLIRFHKETNYHPVLDYMNSLPDSEDDSELINLYKVLGQENDLFTQEIIFKFLCQAYCMLHNGEDGIVFGADITPILQGEGGIGKTLFVFHLFNVVSDACKTGMRISDSKDSLIQLLGSWCSELGEVAGSFKKTDINLIKSFLTEKYTEVRMPYEKEAIRKPRKTVFIATTNDNKFLYDRTGNRRFFPILCPSTMTPTQVSQINVDLVWSYIKTYCNHKHNNGIRWDEIFRISSDAKDYSKSYNIKFETEYKGEAELLDMLITDIPDDLSEDNITWLSSRDLAVLVSRTVKYSAQQITWALRHLNLKTKKGRSNIVYYGCVFTESAAKEIRDRFSKEVSYLPDF